MSSLKPCPFCGSIDIDSEDCSTMQTNGTRIACNGCGVMVEGYGGSTCTARATAKWNTRAADATAERLAGLLKEYCSNAPPGIQERIDAALAAYDAAKEKHQ